MKTRNESTPEYLASYRGLVALVEEAKGKGEGMLALEYPLFLKIRHLNWVAENTVSNAIMILLAGMIACAFLTNTFSGLGLLPAVRAFGLSLLCFVPGILLLVRAVFLYRRRKILAKSVRSDWTLSLTFVEAKHLFDRLYPMDKEIHEDLLKNPDALRALISAEIIELGPLWKIDNLTGVQDMRWRNLKLLATLLRIPEPVSARERLRRENSVTGKWKDKLDR